jgi:uroporphyrin-III C-methyltransferase
VAEDIPCAAISHAATPQQTHVASTLAEFSNLQPGPAPLLLLVGRAMESLLTGDAQSEIPVKLLKQALELAT